MVVGGGDRDRAWIGVGDKGGLVTSHVRHVRWWMARACT